MIGLILPISILLYIGLPGWMLMQGRPFLAGIAMIVAALLPWMVWLSILPGRLGPGAGVAMILTAAMLVLAIIPLTIGIARAGLRLFASRMERPR